MYHDSFWCCKDSVGDCVEVVILMYSVALRVVAVGCITALSYVDRELHADPGGL